MSSSPIEQLNKELQDTIANTAISPEEKQKIYESILFKLCSIKDRLPESSSRLQRIYGFGTSPYSIVKTLVEKGITLNITNTRGKTPLYVACNAANVPVINELLQYVKKDDPILKGGLIAAVIEDSPPPPPPSSSSSSSSSSSNTVDNITYDIMYIINLLLEKGADINEYLEDNGPALFWAINSQNLTLIKFLLEKGAKTDTIVMDESFLEFSLSVPNINIKKDIISLLLKYGADVNRTHDANPPLLHQVMHPGRNPKENIILAKQFLQAGALIDAIDSDGNTALHRAVSNTYNEMVSMLLINGANINAVNKVGKTPLRLAIEQKDPDLINRLLAYFPTIDPTNIDAANTLIKNVLRSRKNIKFSSASSSTASSSSSSSGAGAFEVICDKIGLSQHTGQCAFDTMQEIFFFADGIKEITQPLFYTMTHAEIQESIKAGLVSKSYYEPAILKPTDQFDFMNGIRGMRNRFHHHYDYLNEFQKTLTCSPTDTQAIRDLYKKAKTPSAILKRTASDVAVNLAYYLVEEKNRSTRNNSSKYNLPPGASGKYIWMVLFNKLCKLFSIPAYTSPLRIIPLDQVVGFGLGSGCIIKSKDGVFKIDEITGHETGCLKCNGTWHYYDDNYGLFPVTESFITELMNAIFNKKSVSIKTIGKQVYLFTLTNITFTSGVATIASPPPSLSSSSSYSSSFSYTPPIQVVPDQVFVENTWQPFDETRDKAIPAYTGPWHDKTSTFEYYIIYESYMIQMKSILEVVSEQNIRLLEHLFQSNPTIDVNVRDRYDNTPLMIACSNKNIDIVRLLVEKGADVKATTASGYTALHRAATADIVRLLIEKGADVNAEASETERYYTPLHTAVVRNNPDIEIVKALLNGGANIAVEDKYGETAFDKIRGISAENPYNRKLIDIKQLLSQKPVPESATSSSSSRQRTTRRKQARRLKRRKTRRMSS